MNFITEVLVAIAALMIIYNAFAGGFGRDDTDEPNGKRSGMVVYTDYGTGIQYISTTAGGLTVRVDQDGKPMIDSSYQLEKQHD